MSKLLSAASNALLSARDVLQAIEPEAEYLAACDPDDEKNLARFTVARALVLNVLELTNAAVQFVDLAGNFGGDDFTAAQVLSVQDLSRHVTGRLDTVRLLFAEARSNADARS